MTPEHATQELLERYVEGDGRLAADVVWALEAHLETCRGCRDRIGVAVRGRAGGADALLAQVRLRLDDEPAPASGRWRAARWAPPTLAPWLVMTVTVLFIAVALDVLAGSHRPPHLLLLAPVTPLASVAAAWSQGRDPAFELTAATPRAGLELMLRRTLVVLAVVMPVLTVGGLVAGASPVRWLVPCLAFTASTLALGSVFGLTRAALGLGLVWTAAVVAPTLVTRELPVAFEPASTPVWAAAVVVGVAVLMTRRRALTELPSDQ
ncbi:zf-HC2 domain-containing protein [Lentzea tibetensis]|uniref:Zf-HC2 domain-containing protein n=1 Tax=Lentzea tibetensis TaxID=2591470 RepID=A0A563EEV7_9PSEU|nr:zf-HC2 domain-containing protein [Lentzea tibetensis]TWP43520.1 zf-HC2 domain-containing protein [Lentzea tibetensis]